MQRKLITGAGLFLLATILVGFEALWHLNSEVARIETSIQSAVSSPIPMSDDTAAHMTGLTLRALRLRIMLLLGIGIAAVLSGVFWYRRHVTVPLRTVRDAIERVAAGRLDQTVPADGAGDIGKIGHAVNDLAVNQQESLLFIWNHSKKAITALNDLTDEQKSIQPVSPTDWDALQSGLRQFKWHMQEIQTLIASFDYFEVQFADNRMLTVTTPSASGASDRPAGMQPIGDAN